MNAKIKLCPFCGSDQIVACQVGPMNVAMVCQSCNAKGPIVDCFYGGETEAVKKWNKRRKVKP